jgi:teichoic acid transport system ATP-binding protein
MDFAIKTTDLHKVFPLSNGRMTAFKRFAQMVRGQDAGRPLVRALTAVNLEIPSGRKVALIGNNGAGKSTLLRTIAGIYQPTSGRVQWQGTLTLLTGWGLGLIDDLSVKENVYLYGAIYGLNRRAIGEKYRDIIAWAEVEPYENSKLGVLSSGMKTRLAFSTIRHVESDIFLLDEAFSAGDKNFREKCDEHFLEAKNASRTYLIATHSLETITRICSEALWLEKGRVVAYGPAAEVIADYRESKVR